MVQFHLKIGALESTFSHLIRNLGAKILDVSFIVFLSLDHSWLFMRALSMGSSSGGVIEREGEQIFISIAVKGL